MVTFRASLNHSVSQPPVDKEKGISALQKDIYLILYTHTKAVYHSKYSGLTSTISASVHTDHS